jgi:hypothetical protein
MRKVFETLLDRDGLRLLMLLSLSVVAQTVTLAEEEKLYYFIDENGVTHLSNTPSDPRYRAFVPKKQGKEPNSSSTGDDVSPEEAILPGSEEPDESLLQPMEPPPVPESPPEQAR